jgi:hypothetical protein
MLGDQGLKDAIDADRSRLVDSPGAHPLGRAREEPRRARHRRRPVRDVAQGRAGPQPRREEPDRRVPGGRVRRPQGHHRRRRRTPRPARSSRPTSAGLLDGLGQFQRPLDAPERRELRHGHGRRRLLRPCDRVHEQRRAGPRGDAAPRPATRRPTSPARSPSPTSSSKSIIETVKTIAHWLPATKRALSDAAQIRTLIDTFLTYGLEEELEDQMVNGNGTGENFEGILSVDGVQDLNAARRRSRARSRARPARSPRSSPPRREAARPRRTAAPRPTPTCSTPPTTSGSISPATRTVSSTSAARAGTASRRHGRSPGSSPRRSPRAPRSARTSVRRCSGTASRPRSA